MEAVASVAGVGKPAIYRRFRDKAELVATVIDGQLPQLELPDVGDTRAELWSGVERRLPRRRAGLRRADRRPDRRAGTPPRADRGVPAHRAAPAPRDRAGGDRARPGARRHPRRHPVRGGAGPAGRPAARPRVRRARTPARSGGEQAFDTWWSLVRTPKGTPHDRLHRRDADRPPGPRRLRLRDRPGPALHLADQHRLRARARTTAPTASAAACARSTARPAARSSSPSSRSSSTRPTASSRSRSRRARRSTPTSPSTRRTAAPGCASARTASSSGPARLIEPLVARMLRKQFAQHVATLKQVLERRARRRPDLPILTPGPLSGSDRAPVASSSPEASMPRVLISYRRAEPSTSPGGWPAT